MAVETTTRTVTCPNCGEDDDKMLRIRAQYEGMGSAEIPEKPMCLSCALSWPDGIWDWWTTPDGMINIRHRAVIGEWGE